MSQRQRSVLVVGEGLTAASTAGFLAQAGLDPVVASAGGSTATGHTVVWRPGLVLLERIGLRRPLESLGTPLDSRHCLTANRSTTAPQRDRPWLLAVDTEALDKLVESTVLDSIRQTARSVTAIESTDSGVAATFEKGVTEPFDAVVTADRSLLSGRPAASTSGLHEWTAEWPRSLPAPPAPAEAWADNRAAFVEPVADRHCLRLVSTAEIEAGTALSVADLDGRFGRLFESHVPFGTLDQQTLQYSRTPQVNPSKRVTEGTVLVGSAGGSVPGDCLTAALGIEDAWVVADAIAYGPADIEAAVADYDRRRRQRERELVSVVTAEGCPVDCSPPLQRLYARRRLAFGHMQNGQSTALAAAIPERL